MRQPLPSKAGRVLLVTNNRLSLPHPRPAGQLNLNRSRLKIPHHKTDASLQDSTFCRYRICPLTEHLSSLRILKQVADFTNLILCPPHFNGGPLLFHLGGKGTEIRHMGAKENRLAEARRLKNIVSSSLDQTATDKRNIAYSIEILQLPHRIEKRNIFIKANPTVKLALFFKA